MIDDSMGSFSDLLDYLDSIQLKPTLSRHILPKVTELTGHAYEFYKVELNEDISRGHVRPVKDPDTQFGFVNQVRFSSNLNLCWMRLVCTKEVMHAFDKPEALTNTDEKLEDLIQQWSMTPPFHRPAPLIAEADAIWMALSALCPIRLRRKYKEEYLSKELSRLKVAEALLIPEKYIGHLFRDDFDEIEKKLREK